jgi:thiamine biosynthesis protein ThiS
MYTGLDGGSFRESSEIVPRADFTWSGLPDGFNLQRVAGQIMSSNCVVANGRNVPVKLPSTIEEFLVSQGLFPRSVVVEHNGEAVAPSDFTSRQLNAGDRLEIVKIVAGG